MIYLSDAESNIDGKIEEFIEEEFGESYSEEDIEYIKKSLERYLRYCIIDWVFDGEVKWSFNGILEDFKDTRQYKKVKQIN
jgi:hypothetical protein